MNITNDFTIRNGVLVGYSGRGGDVIIPDGIISIGDKAFYQNKKIKYVRIPNGVVTIGEEAFSGCDQLADIEIPDSVTAIRKKAFYSCDALQRVVIPGNVKELGEYAFNYSYGLKEVVICEGVSAISKGAFSNCKYLKHVVIPKSINSIGAYAFSNCENLDEATLGDNIKSVGEDAFYQCKRLVNDDGFLIVQGVLCVYDGTHENVVVPHGVVQIGDFAFGNCETIKSIVLPEGVLGIKDNAFRNCCNLEKVIIPESVVTIGSNAFYGCTMLKDISLPENITRLGYAAFENCERMTDIVIPSRVTTIASYLFKNCKSLSSVELPDGIKVIENNAFYSCRSLQDILIPEDVTHIQYEAFYGCKALTNIVIPEGVQYIGHDAFKLCTALSSVVIPESVTEIGESVFESCSELEFFAVVGGKQIIKADTFGGVFPSKLAGQIEHIHQCMTDAAIKKYILVDSIWSLLSSTIQCEIFITHQGKSLTACYVQCVDDADLLGRELLARLNTIATDRECNYAASFMVMFWQKLSAVLLSQLYEAIKQQKSNKKALKMISDCKPLMEILRKTPRVALVDSALNTSSNVASTQAELITSQINSLQAVLGDFFAKLPLTPVDIQTRELLIQNIQSLKSALESYLPILSDDGVTNAASSAYEAYLTQKFNKAPSQALADLCDGLRFLVDSITVYNDLNEFNSIHSTLSSSFADHLPEQAQRELSASFERVSSRLVGYGISGEWLNQHYETSDSCNKKVQITCPISSVAYKKIKGGIRIDGVDASGDINLPDYIDDLPVIKIGENAFAKRADIASIGLPRYLIEIAENAFFRSNITSITIPDNVETIGEKAFSECKSLQRVDLPRNLRHIKGRAFEKCESLTTISIPTGTSYIGDRAFAQCKLLKSIQIPASVSRLGYGFIPQNLVIYCAVGSRAHRYVEENYGYKMMPYGEYMAKVSDAEERSKHKLMTTHQMYLPYLRKIDLNE